MFGKLCKRGTGHADGECEWRFDVRQLGRSVHQRGNLSDLRRDDEPGAECKREFRSPGEFRYRQCLLGRKPPSGCTSSFQVTFTPTSTVTGASVQVVTQGAPGLDFTLGGSTCTGDVLGGNSCTATVSFTPLAPGLRMGAVELSGVVNGTGGLVTTIPIYGVG